MKYTSTIHKLLFLLILGVWGQSVSAQSTASSPYSSFGLGETGGLDHAYFGGMGNINISAQDSTVANFYNPSSYSTLAKGQPIFSLGFSTRLSTYSENGSSAFVPVANVQHFALVVPFANRFGLAFGLKPYTRRGYEMLSREKVGEDSLFYRYNGTGGLNEFFLGFGADVIKKQNTRLSLGFNLGYLFGTSNNQRTSALIDVNVLNNNYEGGIGYKRFRSKSFHYEFGLSFEQDIKAGHTLGLYAVVDPLQKLNGDYTDELYFATNINDPNSYDTLYYRDTLKGTISNVPTYQTALMYRWRFKANRGDINERNSELGIHVGFTYYDWSKFENTYDANFVNNFNSSMKYAIGIQFVPETNFIVNQLKTKYYHRMRYRIGAYYQGLPYTQNGEQVTDFGTTFGFGLPVAIGRTLSSVNLSGSIGNRGISDKDAFRENYYSVNVGISITPHSGDTWFRKRKLN